MYWAHTEQTKFDFWRGGGNVYKNITVMQKFLQTNLTSVAALILFILAIVYIFFLIRGKRRLRQTVIEYKLGRLSDQFVDYHCLKHFAHEYSWLGGQIDALPPFAVNNMSRQINAAHSFEDLNKTFNGFRFYDPLIESTHEMLVVMTKEKVTEIAERTWTKAESADCNEYKEFVINFKRQISNHQYAAYELTGIFYDRIISVTKKKLDLQVV